MRKLMLLMIFLLTLLVVGCNQDLVFERIDIKNQNKHIQYWVEQLCNENGVYLYQEMNGKVCYVYFNSHIVVQGEVASYYENVKAERIEDKIVVSFSSLSTDDYKDTKLKNNRLLYKLIKKDKNESVQLLKDNYKTFIY